MLRPTLLFLMHQGPAHGYELLERLSDFGIHDIDPSLIYRSLRVMEAEGWVRSSWDKEKTQGPPRRIYTLTRAGDENLSSYLEDLRGARDRIDFLIQSYEQHMNKGTGDFHDK
jgi:DNA-binding PadR family transcriptional regulator